ncbi:hypothetical protein CC86DRAFT_194288 [Ophiobolus disseminans]|uniref:Uncharacterized protein n=1 Tax=Ophiobolus disseminans TaxID=1469910 RepID=A0A6A7A5F3_9PLEO|nr:hypothetical protein CC86DRAFT_194288 [Ophiobolus disseminans]
MCSRFTPFLSLLCEAPIVHPTLFLRVRSLSLIVSYLAQLSACRTDLSLAGPVCSGTMWCATTSTQTLRCPRVSFNHAHSCLINLPDELNRLGAHSHMKLGAGWALFCSTVFVKHSRALAPPRAVKEHKRTSTIPLTKAINRAVLTGSRAVC